jgi:hypothetical protein
VWSGSLSVVSLFYGNDLVTSTASSTHAKGEWNCALLSEAAVAAKKDQMAAAVKTAAGRQQYGFFMSLESEEKGYSNMTRSGERRV